MQELGFTAMVDPCPADLGRDLELMVTVAERTGFHIVCATGLYKEHGGSEYWQSRARSPSLSDAAAELFTAELTDGIGSTGVRAGIIKIGTGPHQMTDYERAIFEGAAKAAVATGAVITTHTDEGTMGDLQQQVLTAAGAPSERMVIGHSCGTTDHAYHRRIADGGSYLGFDRFGIEIFQSDADRAGSLAKLIDAGFGDRLVVSHDSVWCWRGHQPTIAPAMAEVWHPGNFSTRVVPMLRDLGVTDDQIDELILHNPRRFFSGEALASPAG